MDVETGCGLTGSGTAESPLVAETGDWGYACPIGANGGGVYCDPATGELRSDPPVRQDYFSVAKNDVVPPIPVTTTAEATVDTLTFTITNPDPCRQASVLLFREVDLDIDLPPGSGAMTGLDGDDMTYLGNQGTATIFASHVQANKISRSLLAPGASQTITMEVQAGRGSGGARIVRVQATLRAWIFSNPIG
ncbi:hypothetical protein [[Kitasatospora] papulosa]|uniref:hypothetical protein n=1 Tax=[Kitasatospora] papulosa TaxID=1464011 RepID=UPI0036CF6478